MFLRTCIQISMDNGYIRGIYKVVHKYLTLPTKRIYKYSKQYQSMIGQLLCVRMKNEKDMNILIELFLT